MVGIKWTHKIVLLNYVMFQSGTHLMASSNRCVKERVFSAVKGGIEGKNVKIGTIRTNITEHPNDREFCAN